MSERSVEGYLLKEIQDDQFFKPIKRHLRYFRILFSTGKLNIKTCKDAKQMRSFELRDLLEVRITSQNIKSLHDLEPKI